MRRSRILAPTWSSMAAVERPLFGFAIPSPVSAHSLILAYAAYINTREIVSFLGGNSRGQKLPAGATAISTSHQRERKSEPAIISQVVVGRSGDKGLSKSRPNSKRRATRSNSRPSQVVSDPGENAKGESQDRRRRQDWRATPRRTAVSPASRLGRSERRFFGVAASVQAIEFARRGLPSVPEISCFVENHDRPPPSVGL